MVVDFSDIKRLVKGWIDRELDHKMILRHDDPLVAPLQALGEPMYLLESNPTVERIARLIYDEGRELGRRHRDRPRVGDADLVRVVQRAADARLFPAERQLVREVEEHAGIGVAALPR